ncbi:phospholipid scramblase 1-like [Dasypus novemcinctus]|uniref:phospholipid scramblase 1-like n=1 Tax=Dasypus novemcinctus TaxID=9361 RepID=UPI00265DC244|nr:phospholipid scramblase 1-like [Dasypus novemcinctus]
MDFYDSLPAIQCMPVVEPIPNCPPGLEYLTQVNQLLVRQRLDLLEVLTCLETSNKYEVMNNQGQRIYFAEEKHHCFLLHFCGSWRPFTMTIYDNFGRDVITLYRSLGSSCCWSDCCLQKLKVEAPPGEKIGYVYQSYQPCFPTFTLKNENMTDVMTIRGPCIISNCLMDVNFNLLSLDDEKVIGKFTKQLAGYMTDKLRDANKFGIQFPVNLDVKMKALMLAASFLIDYMYFEICS